MNVLISSQPLFPLSASSPVLGGIAPLIIGIAIVAVLVGMIPWAIRRRGTQPPPPRPEEQPVQPAHRTHIDHNRESEGDSFPGDGSRLTPHELAARSSRPGSARRHRNDQGRSG
ncbi:DUF6479 family protein [Streptomyces sp. NPDC055025]